MSKKSEVETIKVVIRFKGREKLTETEEAGWTFEEGNKVLHAPNRNPNHNNGLPWKFEFDHVLVEADQEKMYQEAAEPTVK